MIYSESTSAIEQLIEFSVQTLFSSPKICSYKLTELSKSFLLCPIFDWVISLWIFYSSSLSWSRTEHAERDLTEEWPGFSFDSFRAAFSSLFFLYWLFRESFCQIFDRAMFSSPNSKFSLPIISGIRNCLLSSLRVFIMLETL